jgi:hypothetical protein
MIRKFSFKNFYSFKDEANISFEVNKKAPNTDAYVDNGQDPNLTKILTVIGPNASGKTNLLKVLPFLKSFIVDSFSYKIEEKMPFKSFAFDNNKNPSEFLVEFEIEKNIYQYKLILNSNKVLNETLKIKNNNRFTTLFKRNWNQQTKEYELDFKKYDLPVNFSGLLRENASIISTAYQIKHKLSSKIINYWKNIQINNELSPFEASEFLYKNNLIKKKVDELLIKFDLGLSTIDVLKKEVKNKDNKTELFYFPIGVHNNLADKNSPFYLSFFDESNGTQHLFLILYQILKTLDVGGVIILDELESDLHPFMIPEIVNLFISPIYNTKNAQLLFSTHQPQILNSLDKYQIILCEKDENGCSENWRLDEIDGVRSDDNYYTKYMSGAYGAIPRV